MSWRIVETVFKLIGHNLENTEFLTEFRIICSFCSFCTFYSTFDAPDGHTIILCEFEVPRSNASQKMTQSGKHGIYRRKLIPNCFIWSKYTPPSIGGSLEMQLSR